MDTVKIFRELLTLVIKSKPPGYQGELAKRCGIDPSHLSDFLHGRKPLSESKRIAVVLELGFEYDEFLALGKGKAEMGADGRLRRAKTGQNPRVIYSRACDQNRPPGDMLSIFTNKKKARQILDCLLEIDAIDPDRLDTVETYISGYVQGMKPQKKTGNGC